MQISSFIIVFALIGFLVPECEFSTYFKVRFESEETVNVGI